MAESNGDDGFDFAHRMSDSDQLMWTIEKDPLLRSTITTVMFLDDTIDPEHLERRVDRCSRLVPRLRQRVRSNPLSIAPPRWEVDPNFDLHYHLRFARVIGQGTERDVLDMAEPVAMGGFDRARPLWQFLAIDGVDGGGSALIVKLHHAITDGVGGMALMMALLDSERHPTEEPSMPVAPSGRSWSQVERFVDAAQHETRRTVNRSRGLAGGSVGAVLRAATDPVGESAKVAATVASTAKMLAPANEPLSPLLRDRSLSQHFELITVPLPDTKAAAKAAGGTLNDAFLAAVAGGMGRYHQRHGVTLDEVRMSMPISTRTDDTKNETGNQFAPARFPLPIDIADPVHRMSAMRELVGSNRAEPALALTDTLAGVLNRLPTSVTTGVFGSMLKGVDIVTSNVPGAPIDVFLCGARMESQFAFGPLAGSAVNMTLLSYVDELHIGVNTDPAAVEDADVFLQCMAEGFNEILDVADQA